MTCAPTRCVILLWAAAHCACGRCQGPPPEPDVTLDETEDPSSQDPREEQPPPRLPKHDWNGITVMMRETEVREALEHIGFSLVPSRLDDFPLLDGQATGLRQVPIKGFTPPIVAYETRREETTLHPVYGLRFWFFRNRLFAFQPIYFTDPVDLVEPEDEALAPEEMEKRLLDTFGTPAFKGQAPVTHPSEEPESQRTMMRWQDEDLVVLYTTPLDSALPEYDLLFLSPEESRDVARFVDRFLPGEEKDREDQPGSEMTDS